VARSLVPRLTRDTLVLVGEASIRELRNHGGRVLARVAGGERVVVTNDGEPVAELRPLPRRPLTASAVQERFRTLPPLDPARFRADVDAVVDQTL
jgi:prevent-host-death family protein